MSSHESGDRTSPHPTHDACGECPLTVDRRVFLRSAALAAVGALAAGAFAPALAGPVRSLTARSAGAMERVYDIPAADGAFLDDANQVIIVRWQGRGYAFSSRCTHKGARLKWRGEERQVFCPRHKARFHPDGTHASGRRARDLDRYDLERRADGLVVHLGALRRADRDPNAWAAAVVSLA